MLRNYFTLYHFAFELRERLEGGYVFEVFSQQRNEITISLITNKGEHMQLLVVTGHPKLCIHSREGLNRKQRNTAALMPEIAEKKISDVTIDPGDRIIRLPLEDNYTIVLQLFSAKTNVLLEKNQRIINSFKQSSSPNPFAEKGLPKPEIVRSLELLAYNYPVFAERFHAAAVPDIYGKLMNILPGFDRQLVRELLGRCGSDCSPANIHTELTALFHELLDPLPSVYTGKKNSPEFSILHNPPENSVKLATILESLNLYSRKIWQHLKTKELVHELDTRLKHKMAKIERELAHFQPEKLRKQVDEYERNGHLLIANLYNLDRKEDNITVTNVFEPDGSLLTIPLKPELSLQQNAVAWFAKASKTRAKIEGSFQRKATITAQKKELQRLVAKANELSNPSQVKAFYEANRSVLKDLGLASFQKKETKQLPFKTFAITPKATLYVGKNARNNEQLTFSFAKPHDIWLHARGTAGSHCILRGATMQNTTAIRRAAEIAAFYSSAKNSQLVPVIYTEKKYIRRARKMPHGQVLTEKENVIMARPSAAGCQQTSDS